MDILFDEQKLSVKYDEGIDTVVRWKDVTGISGYKVYAYPGEVTFLVFNVDRGEGVEVSDEMSGWLELMGSLHTIFPLPQGWEEPLNEIEPGEEDILLYTRK
ncbi:hypothetical protein [Chitinophaga nivalis]|uniref:DUF2283 domain-containing protein n=1 Tax=Chitinophaga nivalis TaxID=2991709 RepID=A0ABT3IKR3_9BACT|nr:hypothetical protein [Chitinophaga nivalis]MCW3465752.1 hypothetical protein [Chitinophaga nivalis]MCW3484557.1 hypothetical protein [Chitinophaga nivalis]